MGAFLPCNLYTTCICSSHRGQKRALDIQNLMSVTDVCEQSCRYWKLDLGPLQEQQLLFILNTEPSLLSLTHFIF